MRNTGDLPGALAKAYAEPALVPASDWIPSPAPQPPTLTNPNDGDTIRWRVDNTTAQTVVQFQQDGEWRTTLCPASESQFTWPDGVNEAVLRSVGKTGQLSTPVVIGKP